MRNVKKYNGFLFERKKKAEMTDEERAKADAASAKAIATKGHEEVRKDQLAAVYLIAKNKHKTIGLGSVPQEEFAAYLDMKPNTYNHTIKKVENIIADLQGAKRKYSNEGDVFKYAELVGKFVKMQPEELQDLAMQAVEGGRERAAKRSTDDKKKKDAARKVSASLVNAVADYVRAGVAAEKAVKAVAKAKGEEEETVQAAWNSRMNENSRVSPFAELKNALEKAQDLAETAFGTSDDETEGNQLATLLKGVWNGFATGSRDDSSVQDEIFK